jgi:hypothetical protein
MAGSKDKDFKSRFCGFATAYYVSGRFAARAGLAPLHGNLLHHAVEMYLKAALVGTLSVPEMKRPPYGHDLKALWTRFKAKEADPALDQFDQTVAALHEFESIRYPDEVVAKGMIANVAWAPHHTVTVGGPAAAVPKYKVIIGDADNLVIEVLRRSSVNPKFFVVGIHDHAREALAYQNPQAAEWGL